MKLLAKAGAPLFLFPLVMILGLAFLVSGSKKADATGTGLSNSVPVAYREIILQAANTCPELEPASLAAQIAQESAWNPKAVSPVGAQGIAQFMPATWLSNGVDGNGDGKQDPFDPADAIPAMAKFMCGNIERAKTLLAEGKVKGEPYDLALAMYNAGEGNVLKHKGIPPFAETLNYINNIKKNTATYRGSNGGHTLPVSSNAIVKEASKYLGVPYVWGGKTANGLDCSGLVSITLTKLGYPEVHGATAQVHTLGKPIYDGYGYNAPWEKLQPGDIIGFDYSDQATVWEYEHIGIYVGERKMIHAPRPGTQVRVEDLGWTLKHRWAVRRLTE